jgi:hypothetical protein
MKHSKLALNFLLAALAVAACKSNGQSSNVGGSFEPPAGGGSKDPRPKVVVTAPLRDTSSVDPHLRVNVSIACVESLPCMLEREKTLANIGSHIRIVGRGNESIAVDLDVPNSPVTSSQKTPIAEVPRGEYSASFLSRMPLRDDDRYDLEITSDATVLIGFVDSTVAEQDAGLAALTGRASRERISLFTGSAPGVRRIEVGDVPSKGVGSVRLYFSEPLQLGSLAGPGALGIRGKGQRPLAGCVWSARSRQCADAQSTEFADAVDFVLKDALSTVDEAMDGAVVVGANVRGGGGRAVAEGARLRGAVLSRQPSGADALELPTPKAKWASCSSEGDVKCIRSLAAF